MFDNNKFDATLKSIVDLFSSPLTPVNIILRIITDNSYPIFHYEEKSYGQCVNLSNNSYRLGTYYILEIKHFT